MPGAGGGRAPHRVHPQLLPEFGELSQPGPVGHIGSHHTPPLIVRHGLPVPAASRPANPGRAYIRPVAGVRERPRYSSDGGDLPAFCRVLLAQLSAQRTGAR
jgi:hypothetical protein